MIFKILVCLLAPALVLAGCAPVRDYPPKKPCKVGQPATVRAFTLRGGSRREFEWHGDCVVVAKSDLKTTVINIDHKQIVIVDMSVIVEPD